MFGPQVEFINQDADPMQSPTKRKKRRPWVLVFGAVVLFGCCLGGVAVSARAFAAPSAAGPAENGDTGPTATLPAPRVEVTNPNSRIETALAPMSNALTPTATGTATNTPVVLWSNTPTPGVCQTPKHFLTQLACNDMGMTATLQSLAPGTVVNVSGVNPNVTVVYLYPSNTATPWIVTTTPTWTPYPTYTPFPSHTFTPYPTYTRYPTYTPWVLLTAPPLVTAVVTVEVTREITVVVTPTASETPTPTETPTETETPTP